MMKTTHLRKQFNPRIVLLLTALITGFFGHSGLLPTLAPLAQQMFVLAVLMLSCVLAVGAL